jgi:RNase P protein component
LAAAKKPADHVAVMSGNRDDHFRLGIKITRQAAATAVPKFVIRNVTRSVTRIVTTS